MYAALPQKYRPHTLSELAGQEYIQRTLSNAVKTNKIAPAYLFAGERGTGKTSTARILAKSLNCTNTDKPTVKPCGNCQSCRSIEKGNSLDVSEIDAASHNGVDDARGLIERSHFAPAISRYRVFILDECHCLSSQAFNALLKCLEEPPHHVVFILCTTEQHKVLPTINSRCQTFLFRSLPILSIVQQLTTIAQKESIAITEAAKIAIARAANGGMRDALQLLDQLSLLGEEITSDRVLELSGRIPESDLVAILQSAGTGDALKLLQLSRELIDSGKNPKMLLGSLLACYRDLLLVKSVPDCSLMLVSGISHSALLEIADAWDYNAIANGLEQLRTSEWQLSKSAHPTLWLELCLLGLAKIPQLKSYATDSAIANPCQSERTSKLRSPRSKEQTIWEKVLLATSENNRALLSAASLVALTEKKAVLAVPTPYLDKFNRNAAKVQKIFLAATGIHYQVSFEEKTS
ncbi:MULTISPECIES: DNA polymerase III subunit gamma/tau [Kamptonema]|uniref:DNA polymerase III subunit gamma/tau n=1 Tax=Kamptonema TaxID=1501433 RepID=UPI0001DACC05|nr:MULTISPECIES: DNA polymerase III subunit gamma/tau [Kamptonema]CBN55050.1 putative DNA polymerase III, subunits gamma and tau [Kamptonema sp. PCC 6506]